MYTTIDLFAGIGGIRLGFEECQNLFTSEIDSDAQTVYHANFGEQPQGDIHLIDPHSIPKHDILLAGFPCQPFSIAGKGLGFADTRGTLFFNIETILAIKRPKAFLLENVKRLTTHDNGRTLAIILNKLQNLGYTVFYSILNSLYFGIPQKRERIYIVGFSQPLEFHFPKPLGNYKSLIEILEDDSEVPENYFLSPEIRQKRLQKIKNSPAYPSIWHENIAGNISALPYSCALRASGSYNYLVVNGIRRLTTREMLRLQGFPESFKMPLPYSSARKVIGNSVTVPVIKAIAVEMMKTLQNSKQIAPKRSQFELFGVNE